MNYTDIILWPLLGGVLIGLASILYLWLNGRIAGISGIVSGVFRNEPDRSVRIVFIVGLILGGFIMGLINIDLFQITVDKPVYTLVFAGLLVGFGSVMGGGCTSGHGVCGLGRLSVRALVSVMVFLTTAVIVTYITEKLL